MIDSEAYVRAVNFLGFEEIITERGGDFRQLLREAGLREDILSDLDALISFRKHIAFCELAARRINLPELGIVFAVRSAPEYPAIAPMMMLSRFAKNLSEFFQLGVRYLSFHTNAYTFLLLTDAETGTAKLRIAVEIETLPIEILLEAAIGHIAGLARTAAHRPDLNPVAVRFQHRRPADTSLHEALFRCPIEFSAEHTEIEFPKSFLEIPTDGGLRLFRPLMNFYMTERIRRMPFFDRSATATVGLAIPAMMGTGACNIESVADALGQNVKQLQRQLAKENTSFSEILEEKRKSMAKQMLAESSVPIGKIAGLLDYAGPAPFTTAFQRWEGKTPLKFRQVARKSDLQPAE
jgi:AraC-like DNA-binding protein